MAFATAGVQVDLADLEDRIFRKQLADVAVRRPVFITALPRAGTTLLLQLTSGLDEFASHCYRDMPFVLLPLLWDSLSRGFRQQAAPSERAHGDGMLVDLDSAEAFEEMLWKAKWPGHYRSDRIVPWGACDDADAASFFSRHMKKIVTLRQRRQGTLPRYISKNNCNIARIACIRDCWSDADIVVPFREPLQHATSLLRQHRRFLQIHANDSFAQEYMKGIGHFDFGANLRPIDFGGWMSKTRHSDPETIGFWLEYWLAAYNCLLAERADEVHLLPYDFFCANPDEGLHWLADTIGVIDRASLVARRAEVRVPLPHTVDLAGVAAPLIEQVTATYRSLLSRADIGSIAA